MLNQFLSISLDDEVTVSSLPHPISMFFLGIFAVSITVMFFDVRKFRRDNERMKKVIRDVESKMDSCKTEYESKIIEVSKKIDSRVDKALLSFKKQNKISE